MSEITRHGVMHRKHWHWKGLVITAAELTLPIARFQTKSTTYWRNTEKITTLQKVGGFSMEILTMFSLSYKIWTTFTSSRRTEGNPFFVSIRQTTRNAYWFKASPMRMQQEPMLNN